MSDTTFDYPKETKKKISKAMKGRIPWNKGKKYKIKKPYNRLINGS